MTTLDYVFRRRRAVRLGAIAGNALGLAGAILVAVVVLIALVGFFWTPYPQDEMNLIARFEGPTWSHIMGTDEFGRDILSRVIAGARVSLAISAVAVTGALLAGGTVAVVVG